MDPLLRVASRIDKAFSSRLIFSLLLAFILAIPISISYHWYLMGWMRLEDFSETTTRKLFPNALPLENELPAVAEPSPPADKGPPSKIDPDLIRVIETWDNLSEEERARILKVIAGKDES